MTPGMYSGVYIILFIKWRFINEIETYGVKTVSCRI